ncbi:unnamed protein product [Coregonus sp. 'balchen']|nr:unnamed protein product [Coregonus sp. 'balchen']
MQKMQKMLLVVCALSLLPLPLVVVAEETHCGGTPDRLCDVKPGAFYYEEPPTTAAVFNCLMSAIRMSLRLDIFLAPPMSHEALRLSPDQFKQRFGVQAPHKEDSSIVVYCQRGRRSATALDIMWALGFSRARHYAGGYSDWVQNEEQ